MNDTRSCIAADILVPSEGSGLPWFEIFFGLRLFVLIVELVRDGHQICHLNSQKPDGVYNEMDASIREGLTWGNAQQMIRHAKSSKVLSIFKSVFRFIFDCGIMFFLVPAILWGGIAFGSRNAGWCDGYWEYGMQIAMGVIFAFVYLLLDLLFFSIFDFIQFCIDHKG